MTRASFRRAAALTAILAQLCLAVNLITWLAAADFDLSRAGGLTGFITAVHKLTLLRVSLAFDVGSYVLLVPLVAALWAELDEVHEARSRMYAAGGLAYALVGATGAIVLLGAWPPLIRAYASGADRTAIVALFTAFSGVVIRGMWNVVGAAAIGVWLLGTGTLLRPYRRGLALTGVAAGSAALADSVLTLWGADAAARVALGVVGVLGPLWIVLTAVCLLREPGGLVTNAGRSSVTPGSGRP
jgi:hypothetical protein